MNFGEFIVFIFDKIIISVKKFYPPDEKICSYCNKPFTEKLWCKECDLYCMIEGWTSGNLDIDKLIKDTIYEARNQQHPKFLEWVPFDRFTGILLLIRF